MALKLPDSAVPMGDFPVAKAVDIDFNDGENLQEKLDNGKLGGGGSSEKQIKDWVSGSSYLEGDYIYREGEIYRCLTSNNDIDFDEANWKQVTHGIDELSKEDVEGLLGLTEEEIETMADLIADTEIRTDKTYSSSKIYTELDKINANLGGLCNKKIYCGEAWGTTVNGVISKTNPIGKAGNVIATMKYASGGKPLGYSITTQATLSSLNFYFRWHRESDGVEAYPPDGTEIIISYMIFY